VGDSGAFIVSCACFKKFSYVVVFRIVGGFLVPVVHFGFYDFAFPCLSLGLESVGSGCAVGVYPEVVLKKGYSMFKL
jgi:hypothetical protein